MSRANDTGALNPSCREIGALVGTPSVNGESTQVSYRNLEPLRPINLRRLEIGFDRLRVTVKEEVDPVVEAIR